MKVKVVKIGDSVVLFNGTTGVITGFDLARYCFEISEPLKQSFHIKDIKLLNGVDVEHEVLTIE